MASAPSILASLPTPGRGRSRKQQSTPAISTSVEEQITEARTVFDGPEPSSDAGDFGRLVFANRQTDLSQESSAASSQVKTQESNEVTTQQNAAPQAEAKPKMTKPAALTELDDSDSYRKDCPPLRSQGTPNHGGA